MRDIRTAATAFAATGLAAFGALGATGEVANAAQNLSITGGGINDAVTGVQIIPACGAPGGTICDASQVTATVDQTFRQAFLGKLGLGAKVVLPGYRRR
jgi:hypothetical protein